MGGKKGGLSSLTKIVKAAAGSGLQIASGGIYNPDTGTIQTGESQLSNVMEAASGQKIAAATKDPLPKMPQAENPADQAMRAKAEADAELAKQLAKNGMGLQSTILGGATVADNSNLRKKKLLGE